MKTLPFASFMSSVCTPGHLAKVACIRVCPWALGQGGLHSCVPLCPSLLLLSVKVFKALVMLALEALDVNGLAVNPEEVHLMYLCALIKCFLKPVLLQTRFDKWVG